MLGHQKHNRWLPSLVAFLGIFAGAALLLLVAGSGAAAAASPRLQVFTKPGGLATGKKVRVVVRGAGKGFQALAGATDVTKRFHRARGGRRVAVLRRGKELHAGLNRIAVRSGRGANARWAADSVVLGAHRDGALHVKRLRNGRSAVVLRLRGPAKHRFEHLRITINGQRLRGRSWVIGERTPANRWPLRGRGFRASFGASDGLRYGRNRVTVVAWNDAGDYDRVVRQVRIARSAPLVDAGEGGRVQAGRSVALDGTATRTTRGTEVRYRWKIVGAPKNSGARLRGAAGARPRLVAKRPGRYRIRLVATHAGAGKKVARATAAASAVASAAGPLAASDETTVEVTPKAPPIGLPIQTITSSGGVQVGSNTYQASAGAWAQLVVLDRSTLALERNESFGSNGQATVAAAQALRSAVQGLNPNQLAVISGGGRSVSAPEGSQEFTSAFFAAVEDIGANPESIGEWNLAWFELLEKGRWSVVGVPGVAGSAYANFFGGVFGERAGAGSPAGAITGYLEETTDGVYGFVQTNFAKIDTQVPGSPQGINRIQVGNQIYTSEPLFNPQTESGFHVVVLNSLLEATAQRTFTVTVGNQSVIAEVTAMQEFLTSLSDPEEDFPGYLVIIQSIGNPQGSLNNWLNDQPLVENSYGANNKTTVPRNKQAWYAPKSVGVTLAEAMGELAGPVAHDQIAQLSSQNFEKPNPAVSPGGYTLVASVGSYAEEFGGPIDPGAPPVSRLQATSPGSEARVVGTLTRDRQSFWAVESAGWLEGLTEQPISELAYRPPTSWPLSSTTEQKQANAYIAERLGLDYPDVREAYWQDSDAKWDDLLFRLERLKYPRTKQSFSQATFEALKKQLAEEFVMVEEVIGRVQDWTEVFSSSQSSGQIDLQAVAAPIVQTIESLDKGGSETSASTELIIGESLWVASSVIELTGQDEIAAPIGALAAVFDLAATLSSSGASSGPDAGPVKAKAQQLGVAVAERLKNVQDHLELVGELLVSDWGKLQEASKLVRGKWAFSRQVREGLATSIEIGAKREFNAALLSTAYGVYVVNPSYIASRFKTPAEIYCYESNDESHKLHPLASIEANPASWISRPVGFKEYPNGEGESVIQRYFGLTLPEHVGEIESEAVQSVPQSISQPIFAPVAKGQGSKYLGQDPIAFFADPRFQQKWFWCYAVEEY